MTDNNETVIDITVPPTEPAPPLMVEPPCYLAEYWKTTLYGMRPTTEVPAHEAFDVLIMGFRMGVIASATPNAVVLSDRVHAKLLELDAIEAARVAALPKVLSAEQRAEISELEARLQALKS